MNYFVNVLICIIHWKLFFLEGNINYAFIIIIIVINYKKLSLLSIAIVKNTEFGKSRNKQAIIYHTGEEEDGKEK